MKKIISVWKVALLFSVVAWGCSKTAEDELSEKSEDPSDKSISTNSLDFGGTSTYVVFAWNDLGMHCLNPTYDKLVILPPYNNLKVQVVKRGKVPTLVTSGLTVSYSIDNNTYSVGKGNYGQFWTYAEKLFGANLAPNIGLTGNGLSGEMKAETNFFSAEGIPVVPVYDSGVKDPYQMATITVRDATGLIVASTKATIPTSDEINCAKCHGRNGKDAFDDILAAHDRAHRTKLMTSKPVLCASCHGSPALGSMTPGSSGKFLSEAIHGYHARKKAACYDCHPGATTKCNRSAAHTASDGKCTTCHGTMANVAATIAKGRIPWANEPNCVSCHPGVSGVDTGTALFRNSHGHGNLFCSACHGSPHAMVPSLLAKDNYQALQYQGADRPVKTIGSCGICHKSSRGDSEMAEFAEEHAGISPDKKMACHTCHTEITTETAKWPHAFQWKDSGGNSAGVSD
ncbi:MAG TPA: multiheme c-type cytochrome [Prolixibacteraceae bacterium]|nr:multiheme c-type cytochrome [Prolixibacteraceae bacterium]